MKLNLFSSLALSLIVSSTQTFAEPSSPSVPPEAADQIMRFTPDNGAADRISSADRLRTLSQEIAAETCFLHNDVLADQNRTALTHSISEFGEILNALLHGDHARHIIGPEENPKTIREIESIMVEWDPIHVLAVDVLNDPGNVVSVHAIYAESEDLLAATSHLLSELESEYSHPTEVLMSDMLLIEFAGRQAMLTQKIAYDACLVWSGFGGQEQVAELKEICRDFDLIAHALLDGMVTAGISAAPTAEIHTALEDVVRDWDVVLSHLEHVADSGPDNIRWIDEAMTKKMLHMEAIVEMYVKYSRRAII